MSNEQTELVAQGYDAIYGGMANSPTLLRIWREHVLGAEFSQQFWHISLATLPELHRIAAELRLNAAATFADLACGAGGPGLWIAGETRARLFGIDISPVGVACAGARARELGLSDLAQFAVGSFADTGLPAQSFDGAMSLDALQYAPSKRAALKEVARILRPRGRLAFASYELDPAQAAGVGTLAADPVEDYRPVLEEAGFAVLAYEETPRWWAMMSGAYQAMVEAQAALAREISPVAAMGLVGEASVTLARRQYKRRVLAVAERR